MRAGPLLWIGGLGLELAAGVWLAGAHGAAAVAALINASVAARFAWTLRPGGEPLITRYARCDRAGLPLRAEPYTRGLTLTWALLLAGFALAYALAGTTAWIGGIEAVTVLALFLGEHLLRSRLFPELGRATPWRTCRAIWQADGV